MKNGDLYKIHLKEGSVSFDYGILLFKSEWTGAKGIVYTFLVNGKIIGYPSWDFQFYRLGHD